MKNVVLQISLYSLVPVSKVKPTVTSPRKEGDNAEFTCTASGTHPITYTLHKVGGVTSGGRWSNASGVFTLSNIQRADAGEYRCTADNEAKRPQTSVAVTLEVYCKSHGQEIIHIIKVIKQLKCMNFLKTSTFCHISIYSIKQCYLQNKLKNYGMHYSLF